VAAAVDRVLDTMRAKFAEYGIKRTPTVFVKADAGTYGMGITTATSGEEFLRLNSRGREKMATGKEGVKTTSVIVQEGVTTDVTLDGSTAEPVMYMVCGRVVGGFLRVHGGRGDQDNLNAPGSRFQPLAFTTQITGAPGPDEVVLDPIDAHVYQVIGEVASIATGYEGRLAGTPGAALPAYP
jgi:glutamate--cysteine ligase